MPPVEPSSPSPNRPLSVWQLAAVVLGNVVVAQLTEHRWGDSRLLWLPLLNLVAGSVLLFTRYTQLGKILLLVTFVAALIGLGTCALLVG